MVLAVLVGIKEQGQLEVLAVLVVLHLPYLFVLYYAVLCYVMNAYKLLYVSTFSFLSCSGLGLILQMGLD